MDIVFMFAVSTFIFLVWSREIFLVTEDFICNRQGKRQLVIKTCCLLDQMSVTCGIILQRFSK